MTTLEEALHSLEPGDLITLYQLDTSVLGGPVYYFTSSVDNGNAVFFNGDEYTPIQIEAEEFEYNSRGALPRPKLKIANVNLLIGGIAQQYDDLKGSTLYRIRTFRQFLDNGSFPDPFAHLEIDVYTVDRKVNHNELYIEWELAASIDQADKQLPGRQIIRDTCSYIYRRWDTNTNSFDYSKATCPYTGTGYFDINGNVVSDPALDTPSKTLNLCCKKRFPGPVDLPFGGFPGVSRIST